eukprot:gene7955-8153_t
MADISVGELVYIVQGIEQDIRTDGRSRGDFRPLELETNVIAQADGSARLRLGPTDVLVGVKVELGTPDSSSPDQGRVAVSVECSSCASPEFKGRGGDDWGIELAQALENSLAGAPGADPGLNLKALCLVPGKTCWVVYVDALVLNDGGNVLDALSVAARAALAVTRVYKVEVSMAEDDEPEIELSGEKEGAPLDVTRVPLILSLSQVGNQCVVDLSSEEEPCASASLRVAVNSSGQVVGLTKGGSGGVDPSLALVPVVQQPQHIPSKYAVKSMVLVIKGNPASTVSEMAMIDQADAALCNYQQQQAYAVTDPVTTATASAASDGNVDVLQGCRQQQHSPLGQGQAAPPSPYVLVLLTGDRRINARAVATHLGVTKNRLRLATEEEVAAVTGFEVGSIPPFDIQEQQQHTMQLLPPQSRPLQDLPLPWAPGSSEVELIGVVAQRRRIARLLLFCSLVPEVVPPLPGDGTASYLRRLWQDPVQVICGKTMERSLGRQEAAAMFDRIKVGSVLLVRGKVQANPAAADTGSGHVLDLVAHQLEVLHRDRLWFVACLLQQSYPQLACFQAAAITAAGLSDRSAKTGAARLAAHIDVLQFSRSAVPSLSKLPHISLSKLVDSLLGSPMNKAQQTSNWEARPLSAEQQVYAAGDALVLTALFDELVRRLPQGVVVTAALSNLTASSSLQYLPITPSEL